LRIAIFLVFPYPHYFQSVGFVRSVGDGIVSVFGLENVCFGEMVMFNTGEIGLVLNLETRKVSVLVLGKDINMLPGDIVSRTFFLINVTVGDFLLGSVVDPLGKILIKLVEKNPFSFGLYKSQLLD